MMFIEWIQWISSFKISVVVFSKRGIIVWMLPSGSEIFDWPVYRDLKESADDVWLCQTLRTKGKCSVMATMKE